MAEMTISSLLPQPAQQQQQQLEPEQVLQSLMSELNFCQPLVAGAEEDEQQQLLQNKTTLSNNYDDEAVQQLGRSRVGLSFQEHSNDNNNDESSSPTAEHRNSSDSDSCSVNSSSERVWKTATDPVSGRIYYYDAVSRVTQWEKPDEIRRIERYERREKKRQLQRFFEEMESNIRVSLDRGEVIPGLPVQETPAQGSPKEPLPSLSKPIRVRTISNMNEKLLSQVQTEETISKPVAVSSVVAAARLESVANRLVEGRPPLPHRRSFLNTADDSTREDVADDSLPAVVEQNDSLRGIDLLLDETHVTASKEEEEDSSTSDSSTSVSSNHNTTTAAATHTHVRRNTGGTIYVQSTMDNPDVQATIKAVCGVYRAHIVQSAARKNQRSPVSVYTANVSIDIFRDDYEAHHNRNYLGSSSNNKSVSVNNKEPEIPSLEDIERFYQDFYNRSQMEHDTIIMSLIYIERLVKSSNGVLTPTPQNWRSILFSCMVMSSKVWDDLSMFNLDFSNVSRLSGTGLCSFSLQRTNALELALLTSLNFDVRVPASEYAKYYFLIRTMLSRSGMLVGAELPLTKSQDHGRMLESRTVQYQDSVISGRRERRTRSVDWGSSNNGDVEQPVFKDTLCLEQLVSMK